ncbi:SLBB domain-containing protein [Flavobacterium chuncheonense]|uniref:SLBB domain-containing protein n=1 Tax=Flavobacterium chuncheonense TaxID=2026653 RepID=A0ABW5YJG6_9FLAO
MKILQLLFIIICFSFSGFSQSLFNEKDLSLLTSDQINDKQLRQFKTELNNKQITLEQAQALAISKGMQEEEFNKLKSRLQNLPLESETATTQYSEEEQITNQQDSPQDNLQNEIEIENVNKQVFGAELFNSKSLSFEPNQNMPTPNNYILGPNDTVEIAVFGVQQFNYSGKINKNGTLTIPNVGDVNLSGLTFDAAKTKLNSKISTIFTTLKNGSSKIAVSIANYRSITVTIIGAQQPGNYRLSSMSTIYNALHVAGGPNEIGSYRKIELIRNNSILKQIDLYQFLAKGDQSDNIVLQDNDIIRIPSYDSRITLEGEVKRPGIFEVLPNENLEQILQYASGFTENAYKNRIIVYKKSNSELEITDLNETNYSNYNPKAGDVINVDKILNRYKNRVQIKGAVYRPGNYSLKDNETLTIKDLIEKADGLKENVFLKKASLIREKSDLTKEYISINLEAALNGNEDENKVLQKEDVITIFYNQELLDTYKVSIDGEVRQPGNYDFIQGMSLYDLLLEAQYLTDKASNVIQIFRTKKSDQFNPNDSEKIQSFTITQDSDSFENLISFMLQANDRVVVRKIVSYEVPQMATVTGEVLYSGNYAIVSKEERIFNFIKRAGGLTDEADPSSIKIRRNNINIPINWAEINKDKNTSENIVIQQGDNIIIPRRMQTVHVTGNVMFETEVPYNKGKKLKYYLKNAGNISDKGWLKRSYIVHPNGSASTIGNFLFFRFYPEPQPGSIIIVPEKPEQKKLTTTEVVTIGSVLTSLAGILFAIMK